ncbi:ATP-dependent helicase, partial [Candidatus Parcubacteria bacterium]
FKYILVDEYQDTNTVQAEIVDLLAKRHGNIFVVGDDAQSIYSFRAAEIKNILDFPNRYPDCKIFKLTTNYRSTPQILSVANEVIKNSDKNFYKDLQAVMDEGALPTLLAAADPYKEADFICRKIEEKIATGIAPRDIAVLFRAAFHSQVLEFELMRRGINYEYRGGLRFFERAHIKDAIAYLRIIHNTRDITAIMRALRLHAGIGPVTAQKLATAISKFKNIETALTEPITLSSKSKIGFEAFRRLMQKMLASKKTPADYIRSFISSEEYQDYLQTQYQNFAERLDDLEQFAVFAERDNNLPQFLETVALTQDFGINNQPGIDSVILSTVHQAKGLEWNTVFVINLAEGKFPNARVLNEEGGLDEERRLFYVAITRAKQDLFFTYPLMSGRKNDSLEYNSVSTLLEEIPEDYYRQIAMNFEDAVKYRSYTQGNDDWQDEPMIVLDEMGEPKKEMPASFLRDVDEL